MGFGGRLGEGRQGKARARALREAAAARGHSPATTTITSPSRLMTTTPAVNSAPTECASRPLWRLTPERWGMVCQCVGVLPTVRWSAAALCGGAGPLRAGDSTAGWATAFVGEQRASNRYTPLRRLSNAKCTVSRILWLGGGGGQERPPLPAASLGLTSNCVAMANRFSTPSSNLRGAGVAGQNALAVTLTWDLPRHYGLRTA